MDTASLVGQWQRLGEEVKSRLRREGPALVNRLCASRSLRRLAADAGLSPSYLCLVRTGRQVISPDAYLKLVGRV